MSRYLAGWSIPPSRRLLIWGVVLLAGAATAWALAIRPQPFSDWLYYWKAAEGSAGYERGGVLIFVLRALQELALPPYLAALVINACSAVAILAMAYCASARRIGMALALVYAYLLAITPYYAVVQFDLAATALLCAGFWQLASGTDRKRRAQAIGASIVFVAFAVSTRPQFLLVLLVFASLLVITSALIRGADSAMRRRALWSALVLIAGALLGFAIDSALRADAGRSEAVRTNSGVTLYAGLLSSGTSPPTCGHWSPEATRDAREDAQLPLHEAVAARLQEQPLNHWAAVVRCKAGMIVFPDAYALSWSLGAPRVVASTAQTAGAHHLEAMTPYLYVLEGWSYRVLLWLIYVFTVAAAVLHAWKSRWLHALLPLLWLAAFWTVHGVFEIQGRYFLPLFVVLPLLAAGRGGVLASPSLREKSATPPQGSCSPL